MPKLIKKNNYGLWIAIIAVAIFAVSSVSWAVGSQMVNNFYGVTTVNQANTDNSMDSFGAIATSSVGLFPGLNSLRLFPNDDTNDPAVTRYYMGELTTSGLESGWEICDFAATTTLCSIPNNTGVKIRIAERFLVFEGSQPSGNLNVGAGTSTLAFASENTTSTVGDGLQSLFDLIDLDNATAATSTQRNGWDNKGGNNYIVDVNPGDYIIVWATSTADQGVG